MFFSRWISYWSNRKLSLLKVRCENIFTGLTWFLQQQRLIWIVFLHPALIGFESNNKYEVRNAMGQNVFYAVEENDCLSRQCCGPLRPFTIHILDNFGQEVITITRPLKCMSCFFPCCLQEVSAVKLSVFTVLKMGMKVRFPHRISPLFIFHTLQIYRFVLK